MENEKMLRFRKCDRIALINQILLLEEEIARLKPHPITIEELDIAQFGKILHESQNRQTRINAMNDNVSYAMDVDYKTYELRMIVSDLKSLAEDKATRHIVKKYWDEIYKSAENLKDILNDLPPWEEANE